MVELDSPSAPDYLAAQLHAPPGSVRLTALGGGVSNLVYLVEAPGVRAVVKQALEKLRVQQDWFCTRERIHRECAAIRALGEVLPPGAVPQVYFEDRDNHIFAMEAAPPDSLPWKQQLLAGDIREEIAARVGQLHGAWLRASLAKPAWIQGFSDLSVFDDLRVDPYYRTTAARHPDLQAYFEPLISQCMNGGAALVHGDLSPKNLLAHGDAVMLIDFEVAHWGDPAFDVAFLLNHLLLKAFARPQWSAKFTALAIAYSSEVCRIAIGDFPHLLSGALRHLPALLLARVDGKSPVEYLDDAARTQVRAAARRMFRTPPDNIENAFAEALA